LIVIVTLLLDEVVRARKSAKIASRFSLSGRAFEEKLWPRFRPFRQNLQITNKIELPVADILTDPNLKRMPQIRFPLSRGFTVGG
jgi:hypothetical protein